MAGDEQDSKDKIVSALRVLEYSGPAWWIEQTLNQSAVPAYGKKEFPGGAYIRSGLTHFGDPYESEQRAERMPITLPPPGGRPS